MDLQPVVLLEQFYTYFCPAWRHLPRIDFLTFCWFSGSPNCNFFGPVFEIFLISLEVSPWNTFFAFMCCSHDLQTVVLLLQFCKYFSTAWRHVTETIFWPFCWFSESPNCVSFGAVLEILLASPEASLWDGFLNILLVLWSSKLCFVVPALQIFLTTGIICLQYIFWIYVWYSGPPTCGSRGISQG